MLLFQTGIVHLLGFLSGGGGGHFLGGSTFLRFLGSDAWMDPQAFSIPRAARISLNDSSRRRLLKCVTGSFIFRPSSRNRCSSALIRLWMFSIALSRLCGLVHSMR